MARALSAIDISNVPELVHIAEEASATGAPRLLKRADVELAVVMPIGTQGTRRVKRARSRADREAFLSSAGGWKNLIDTEQLKRNIARSRQISSRPPVDLPG